jgi:DNA-binding NarL/FixJ family response regulator
MSTSAVSRELSISEATARNHIQHVLEKLSAHSRTEAVLRALSERLI